MEILKEPRPPAGLRRLLWRLPVRLYRMGLGGLLGRRMMLLTHTGRVTGRPRQVVLEVVEHGSGTGYVAASGFGARADWYRNIRAQPAATIQVGRQVMPVRAVPLRPDEGAEIMARYAPRHPVAARELCRVMGFAVDGGVADWRAVGERIPFVRFVPRR